MLQPSENINNNPISDYPKRRVISELRQNNGAPECLRQLIEHEKSAAAVLNPLNSQLAFLESTRAVSKAALDVYGFEQGLRKAAPERPATSQQPPEPSRPGPTDTTAAIYRALPFYTSWFDFDRIHAIERQNLGEFFGEKSSKTPKIYQRIRNFLIHLYWRNPQVNLLGTTARRCIMLDACSVLRIHAFLEQWGLINLQSRGRLPGGVESTNLDFVKPLANKADKPPLTATTAFRETPFETAAIERAFERLGMARVKCFQCQVPLQLTWFAKSTDQTPLEGQPQPKVPLPESSLMICPGCRAQENYPIFYSLSDFRPVALWQVLAQEVMRGVETDLPLELQDKITKILAERRLESLTLAEVAAETPELSEDQLLVAVLRVLELGLLSGAAGKETARLDGLRAKNATLWKMERMTESLCDKLGVPAHEHVHRGRSRESLVKPFVHFNQEIHAAFARKAEKSLLRFAFLDDFEKVVYQEKQVLKAFN